MEETVDQIITELRTTIDRLVCRNSKMRDDIAVVEFQIEQIKAEIEQIKKEYFLMEKDPHKKNIFGY